MCYRDLEFSGDSLAPSLPPFRSRHRHTTIILTLVSGASLSESFFLLPPPRNM
jgi:hypothetical protein